MSDAMLRLRPIIKMQGYLTAANRRDIFKQLATAEGRIVGPDGKLYAHATTTCLVFELAR